MYPYSLSINSNQWEFLMPDQNKVVTSLSKYQQLVASKDILTSNLSIKTEELRRITALIKQFTYSRSAEDDTVIINKLLEAIGE